MNRQWKYIKDRRNRHLSEAELNEAAKQIQIMKDLKEYEDFLNENELNESALRKLEKYSDQAWRKLDIDEKINALHSINASGSGQMVKLLNKTQL